MSSPGPAPASRWPGAGRTRSTHHSRAGRAGVVWALWERSAWGVFGGCASGGRQGCPAESSATDRAGSRCLLQPLEVGRVLPGALAGSDDGPGLLQKAAGLDRTIEARVADLVEARGQDVLDQALEELHRMDGGGPTLFG